MGEDGGGGADSRLILQLGMLFSLLYVAFLCVWFSATRHLRAAGAGLGLKLGAQRVRAWWGGNGVKPAPIARAGSTTSQQDSFTPAEANPQWTCQIAWQPGRVQLQAVMAPQDGAMPHLVGESKGLRWPKGIRRPSTRELESALGAMAASIVAAGWEPVQSHGPWSERRFVWRQDGEPPTSFELVGQGGRREQRDAPSAATAVAERPERSERSREAGAPSPAPPARGLASRGANREAVLRAVAERPGATMRELAAATGVNPGSLSPLLPKLTEEGELEKRPLPDGQTGYVLAAGAGGDREASL